MLKCTFYHSKLIIIGRLYGQLEQPIKARFEINAAEMYGLFQIQESE